MVVALWAGFIGCVLVGCAGGGAKGGTRTYPIPTDIDFEPGTGTWTLVCSRDGTAEMIPEFVRVYSMWQGTKYEGVLLVPGTTGFEKVRVSDDRGYIVRPEDFGQLLEIPNYIEPVHGRWRIIFADKRVGIYEREWTEIGALKIMVPVHNNKEEKNGHQSIIEHQEMKL